MKAVFVIIFSTACIFTVFAGRPLQSEDSYTLGKNKLEIEIASEYLLDPEENNFLFPLNFTYGLRDQTDINISFAINSSAESTIINIIDCIDLTIKQNFYSSNLMLLSIVWGVSLTAENNKMNSPAALFTIVPSLKLNNLLFHFNAGYNQNNCDEEHQDIWSLSLGSEYEFSDLLTFVAEFGIGRNPSIYFNTPDSYALTGISFHLSNIISLDTGINFSLSNSNKFDLVTSGITISI